MANWISKSKYEKVCAKTNGRCFYCNRIAKKMEVDHFTPRAKWKEWLLDDIPFYNGNLNSLENLFLACKSCNASKRDKCPEDFVGNSYIAWDRYDRANRRVGILLTPIYQII